MDTWLLWLLNRWAGFGSWLDYLALFLDRSAIFIFTLLLVIRWFAPGEDRRRARHVVLLTIATAISAVGLAQLPGIFYYRPRPFEEYRWVFNLLRAPPSPSFPSTHAAMAFAFAFQMSWRSPSWGWLIWPLTLLMVVVRLYAGVHYPSDKLVGLVMAGAVAWFYRILTPKLEPAMDYVLRLVGANTPS